MSLHSSWSIFLFSNNNFNFRSWWKCCRSCLLQTLDTFLMSFKFSIVSSTGSYFFFVPHFSLDDEALPKLIMSGLTELFGVMLSSMKLEPSAAAACLSLYPFEFSLQRLHIRCCSRSDLTLILEIVPTSFLYNSILDIFPLFF